MKDADAQIIALLAQIQGAAPAGGGDALTTNPLSQFAATTSAQLRGVLSDETGTGAAVFAGSPTLTGTPAIAAATGTSLLLNSGTSFASAPFVTRVGTDRNLQVFLSGGNEVALGSLNNANNAFVEMVISAARLSLPATVVYGTGIRSEALAAPTIASAGTIAPATQILFVSGTAAIATITAPLYISSGGGQITLIPTGIFTTTTAGNIALASTAVVSKALIMTYDSTSGKWYPAY